MSPASTARISLPDRYRVVRHLANGGMASVWEAHDELLDRSVAVKVLGSHLSEDDRARLRFEREARAAAGLSSHPHVVTIYDVGEHGEHVFMVMELMRGGSLADRIRSGREIPRELALEWLAQAAAGLDAAHEANIVHRDVKPANLLLDERDRLAIADFGIARVAQEDQLTQTGQVLGTASYISPEQAMGQPAQAASDRYALAVVAYELLTGSRPFEGEHFAAQARAHVEDEPEPPSDRRPELPATADAVLLRGLAKEPADRWPTATEMVHALEDALEGAPDAAPASEPTRRMTPLPAAEPTAPPAPRTRGASPPPRRRPERMPPPPDRGRRGGRAGVLLAALAAAALVGVLAVVLLGGGADPQSGDRADRPKAKATATPAKAKAKRTSTPKPAAEATATATATSTPSATTTAAPDTDSAPASGTRDIARATSLQRAGFAARNARDYAKAITLSTQALEACGGGAKLPLDPCGYAMFELGVSLNRSGRPREAIPYLKKRLAYGDNAAGEVKAELTNAQRKARSGS